MTGHYKFPFHRAWLVVNLTIVAVILAICLSTRQFSFDALVMLALPLAMAGIGFATLQKLPRDFVDEVIDRGDSLMIRNDGEQWIVTLAQIQEVNYMGFERPQRLTLVLRGTSPHGKTITFVPRYVPFAFSSHPIASDLKRRLEAIHSRPLPNT